MRRFSHCGFCSGPLRVVLASTVLLGNSFGCCAGSIGGFGSGALWRATHCKIPLSFFGLGKGGERGGRVAGVQCVCVCLLALAGVQEPASALLHQRLLACVMVFFFVELTLLQLRHLFSLVACITTNESLLLDSSIHNPTEERCNSAAAALSYSCDLITACPQLTSAPCALRPATVERRPRLQTRTHPFLTLPSHHGHHV